MSAPHTLNAPQRAAVLHVEGPCLVLAGAGSGKTRVITHKIAHLVTDLGYQAKQIAALTFTNKAATEMRQRVGTLLEAKQSRGLTVSTFHALGLQILRQEAEYIGLRPRFSILSSDDSRGILQDLSASTDPNRVKRLQTRISLWKNAMLTPDSMEREGSASDTDAAADVRVYRSYQATLRAYHAVDFDDLIGRAVGLFEAHPDVLYRWQSRLRYLLIDEVQDTNACQYRLLRLLAGTRAALTAVGDDDQAIYAWRGATLDNLENLQRDYPNLRVIKLEQNYRSSGRILSAANALIASNPKLFEKILWSEHGPGDAVTISPMNDDLHEAESVAIRMYAHRFDRKSKWSDYAILYRGNHQARVFEEALRKEKIPYVLSGGQSFFERTEIRDLMAWMRLFANVDDDPAFIRAVTVPKRGVGAATLEALGDYATQRNVSLFEAACESAFSTKVAARQFEPLEQFTQFANRIQDRAEREPAGRVLDDLLSAIDYRAHLLDSGEERAAQKRWQNVLDFTAWVGKRCEEDGKSLIEVTQSIALLSMLGDKDEEVDAVLLSTLHAAKGLEFGHVFLVGVEEGILPHKGHENDDPAKLPQRIEEERRLMYVGVTRAQRSLSISWCKKRRRARDDQACEPSRFIGELGLEQGPKVVDEEMISPQQRMANLKALLNTPRPARV
ncbi:MAG: UvrD-helicase domain-containing protein [Burkholderiaceae bacterium]